MRALVFRGVGDIRLEDVPRPEIQGPEDAIIRVTTTSICGSDLHILRGLLRVEPGTVIGHEFVGIVEETGSSVTKVKPGDRVVSMAAVFCGRCRPCRNGLVSACENGGGYGCGPRMGNLQGVQAEYARVLYANETLEKIPEGLTDEQVLFVGDILATAYTGVMGVNPDGRGILPGSVVAVFGSGPVGLCAVAVARLQGASQVIALDSEDYRLAMAARMGADKVINVAQTDPVTAIKGATNGWGADLIVEAAGSPVALTNSLAAAAIGGRVTIIGVHSQPVEVPFHKIINKNITIQTGLGNFIHVSRLIKLIETGKLDLTPLITHRMPLSEVIKGYEIFEKRLDDAIKIVIKP